MTSVSSLPMYAVVRVVRLLSPHTDEWHLAKHGVTATPQIGDTGTVLEILSAGKAYVVEDVEPNGRTRWLAIFALEELELVE